MKSIIVLILCLFSLIYAQDTLKTLIPKDNVEYYKVSKIRIYVSDPSEIQKLRKEGLGIERVKYQDGYFDTYLDEYQMRKLKESGFSYEIIIPDVTKDYLEKTKELREEIKSLKKQTEKPCGLGSFGYGSMGGFYTFDEVVAELDAMHQLYPNLITEKDSVGSSIEGRPIWTVKISDNPNIDENEPEVFYNSLIHATEPGGMMAVMKFMYYLLENYGSDPEVTYLVDNRELYFMPVINPDGYVYNEKLSPNGGGMWRKNRRNNGDFTFGVDLNRNFGYMWGCDNLGSSKETNMIDYRGTGPFSEPETQNINRFCSDHNFAISVNYHTYWDVVFAPWGYNLQQTPDSNIFNRIISYSTVFNGYKNGFDLPNWENYASNGDVLDWMYGETVEKNRIFGFLIEVGGDNDGHWPTTLNKIIENSEENVYPNLVYAWGPGIIDDVPYIETADLSFYYINPSTDTLKIFVTESNPNNYNNSITADIIASDNSIINTIQLNKTDNVFTGSLLLNSLNEDYYSVMLKQVGTEIPINFNQNELKFTTVGPIQLESYNVTRLDSNTIYLKNLLFTNQSTINSIPFATVNAKSVDDCLKLVDGEKQLGKINPLAQVLMNGGFLFKLNNCVLDSAEINIEISSEGNIYWNEQITFQIPNNYERENFITVFYDEANDISNWICEGGWNITTESSVSAPYSFTDSPNGDYKDYASAKLTSKNEFKLLNSIYSFIEFDTKWIIDGGDYAMVQLSIDNETTWIPLKGQYNNPGYNQYLPSDVPLYTGIQPNWVHEVIDISQYTNHTFKLRYLLKSSQDWNGDGLYIDNIKLSTYSAIYGDQLFLDKKYAIKDVDSVLFNIRFSNPNNHDFASHLIFSNVDKSIIDSVELHDDGLNGDKLPKDNIFGSFILPLPNEDIYTLSVSSNDYSIDKYFKTENLFKFTNAGPLKPITDSIEVQTDNATRILIKNFGLYNEGLTKTIPKVLCKVYSTDTNVVSFNEDEVGFVDIKPGETKFVSNAFQIVVKQIPDSINLNLDISSDKEVYWKDKFTIYLIPTEVSYELANLPNEYELYQNYPNPFNPSTTIKYSIPKQCKVTLQVFDVLGSKTATLVNKEQTQGNYEIEFYGNDLTSGIYFYRLQASDFVETRKMVLLK